MPQVVTTGATLQCTFGASPAALVADPGPDMATVPMARITDFKPTTNIPTFGMCMSLGNPQVSSATTAAQGVLTPMPCVPATTSPWTPGSVTVSILGSLGLTMTSTCACTYGGVISISAESQTFALDT